MSTFPGPVPPESNPPINPQYYKPSRFVIVGLGLGYTTLITTAVNHNYVIGQNVRLLIPFSYGTTQLSGQQGYVLSIPQANQVVVGIDSTHANAFIASPTFGNTPPQIVAIGDINSGQINSNRSQSIIYIPGSFINISPN